MIGSDYQLLVTFDPLVTILKCSRGHLVVRYLRCVITYIHEIVLFILPVNSLECVLRLFSLC